MNALQRVAERIDNRLGAKGKLWKYEFVAMMGEFIGTTMFLFLSFGGTHIANLPDASVTSPSGVKFVSTSNLLFISLAFGISLIINAWVFFRVSGALFNPAITLALVIVRVITPIRAILFFIAQLLGGIAAAALIDGLMPGPINFVTNLSGGINTAQGLFLEIFLTAQLVLVVFMLAVEKHKSTFLAPIGIGLTLFVGEIVGVYYTGGSLNPARSFGPQVIMGSFPTYHWIYWVGPFLGALVSTGLYATMKVLDYEKINGTQDRDDTILIAHIMPRPRSCTDSSTETTIVVPQNGKDTGFFGSNNLLVTGVKAKTGRLSPTAELPESSTAGMA